MSNQVDPYQGYAPVPRSGEYDQFGSEPGYPAPVGPPGVQPAPQHYDPYSPAYPSHPQGDTTYSAPAGGMGTYEPSVESSSYQDSYYQQPQPQQPPPHQESGQAIRVSVAVVDPHPGYRDHLVAMLGGGGTPFNTVDELSGRLTGAVPVVVVLGPSNANAVELEKVERLIRAHPALGAILIVEELTTTLLQQGLRCGIRDVLTVNGDASQLPASVQRVAMSLNHASFQRPVDQSPEGAPAARGEVISIFSTKGGAGKSVIACNLAIALAQRTGESVCLVDADLQFGDVAVMLKLAPRHTIVDAVTAIDRLDVAMLDNLLITHEQSGVRVLPAPLEPAFADQVGAGEMVAIVDKLRSLARYVVVDTPAYFNDVVLGLVEISDTVALIAGMDIPNIKNVKIGLQTLRLLNTPQEKLMLVLNRSNSKVKLDIAEVERTLQVKADALVPSDVLIPQSVNRGVPVVLNAPKSPVAKSIYQLADLVISRTADRSARS